MFFQANNKFGGLDILVSNAAVNPAVSPILEVKSFHIIYIIFILLFNIIYIDSYIFYIFLSIFSLNKMFSQTEENVWDKIFEINVKCSWLLAKEAYPELMKSGGGSIVFVSSIAAYNPMQVIYTNVP